ncbi:MAG TPA: hypothetical protein VEW71_10125 [Allosphingosinicella sp.]|nr:hypothetical protein [Allosphingosinicella sp.]
MSVGRSQKTLTFILLLFLVPFGAIAQVWCSRPSGAGIQAALHTDTKAMLPLLERLAGGGNYLVLRRPSAANLGDAEAFRAAYVESARSQELGIPDERLYESAQQNLDELADSGTMSGSDGATATAYLYSNSARFAQVQRERGEERNQGGALEGTPQQFEQLLTQNGNEPPRIHRLLREWNITTVFVSGFEISREFIEGLPPGHTVIKIPDRPEANSTDLFATALDADPRHTAILFAMPTTAADARAWGFDSERAQDYASAGAAAQRSLNRAGIEVVNLKGMSSEAIAQHYRQLRERGMRVTLLGEGADNGASVRIPGATEPFRLADHRAAMDGVSLMFCNSTEANLPSSLSVMGRIYINEAERMILALAAPLAPATPIAISRDQLGAAKHYRSSWIAEIARLGGTDNVTMHRFADSGGCDPSRPNDPTCPPSTGDGRTVSPNGEPPVPPSNPRLWLFVVGMVGGSLKEFMRWRQLAHRGRIDQYSTPLFYLFTLGFVLFAGAVGLLFGQLIPNENLGLIVGFTAGVGLEEIVRLAAKLRIWKPNVPLGSGDHTSLRPASVSEFLRR